MKRRSFLKSVLGFLALPFVPKAKVAMPKAKKAVKPVVWRKWATLEKKPEAATAEDFKVAQEEKICDILAIGKRKKKRFYEILDSTFSKGFHYILVEGGHIWRFHISSPYNRPHISWPGDWKHLDTIPWATRIRTHKHKDYGEGVFVEADGFFAGEPCTQLRCIT